MLDQRHVGRRPAHIEGQDVLEAAALAKIHRAGHAAGGARHQQVDRRLAGCARRRKAAVGTQDGQVHLVSESFLQRTLQVGDVFRHLRPDIGIDDGGLRALVLLHLGHDLAADRYRYFAKYRLRHFACLDFVGAVDIGVQQANRQRLDLAGRRELLEVFRECRFVERADDVAARVHALVGFDRQLERRQQR